MDADTFEQKLRTDGFEVLTRDMEPGKALPEHAHPWDVRGLVLAGTFTIETADGATTYAEGETFELAAGTRHAESHGDDGGRLLLGRRHRDT